MATLMVVTTSRGTGQQRQPAHPDTLSPQQICKWVFQRGRRGSGGYGFMWTRQRQQQRQKETFSPQRLRNCVSQRGVPGCAEVAALGASKFAAALGASESPAALGATGVADTLETRLADARRRHEAGEYGRNLSLVVVELGIRAR
ncbi:unnamed protein product [Closterium sp. NIES-54]